MTSYRDVPPDLYFLVKKGLQNDYVVSQYPSFHESMYDSFEIISLDGKISIYYYKEGRLVIQSDIQNLIYKKIIRQVNKIISKKVYL